MLHKTLERQLKKYLGSDMVPPKEWEGFLSAISGTYTQYDEDHVLIERSLEISSKEHMEYAEKLRQSEKKYRTLVENSWNVTVLIDKDLKTLYASPNLQSVLGYTPDEWGMQTPQQFMHPDDFPAILATLKDVFSQPNANRIVICRIRHKDGSWRWIESSITNLFDDPEIAAAVVNFRDITDSKLADDALKASEERFLAFMENSPAIAWMKDEHGKYTYINSYFERRFNITIETIKGKTDFDLFAKEVAEALRNNDQKVFETGKQMETEETVPTPDGIARVWLTYKFPFRDENNNKMIGGMAIDITDQKTREEVLQTRTQELEMLNKTMVGRELKMVELKETIRGLKQRLGEE